MMPWEARSMKKQQTGNLFDTYRNPDTSKHGDPVRTRKVRESGGLTEQELVDLQETVATIRESERLASDAVSPRNEHGEHPVTFV
jgi:hypothetical protein